MKKLLIGSSIALGSIGIIYACGGGDYYSSEMTNFAPENFVDTNYIPLFYDGDNLFYSNMQETNDNLFYTTNIKDWKNYIGNDISESVVEDLLYKKSRTEIANFQVKQKSSATKLSGNPRFDAFIQFLQVVKTIENYSVVGADYWKYEPAKREKTPDAKINTIDKAYMNISGDEFLKNRYWFQVIKSKFYSESPTSVIDFWNKTNTTLPKNQLYYRGLSYLAGVYVKKGDFATANYYNSIVFGNSPRLMLTSVLDFNPENEGSFQKSLAMAKNTEEKENLWALIGYYADDIRAINELYKLNPASKYLDLLLSRFVNKQEIAVYNYEIATVKAYKDSLKVHFDSEGFKAIKKIADEDKIQNKVLWSTAAGYLSIYEGDYSYAAKSLNKGKLLAGSKDKSLESQIRLLTELNNIIKVDKLDANSEAAMVEPYSFVSNITSSRDEDDEYKYRYSNSQSFANKYIASIYNQQKDYLKSELFVHNSEFYQKPENQQKMLTYMQNPNKKAWDQIALKQYQITQEDIYYYQATLATYDGDLDKAIKLMELTGDLKNEELPANPFNGKIKDCNDCDFAAKQSVKYTKISFLKKLKEMKTKLTNNEDVYNNSQLLGNAYYNMSYFGNARAFYYGDVMEEYGNYVSSFHRKYLYNMSMVKNYYMQSMKAATNDEQKAKMSYMLAKLERNDFYVIEYFNSGSFYSNPEVAYKAWNGFKDLKTKYAHTQYYKEVINECGYFEKYAKK